MGRSNNPYYRREGQWYFYDEAGDEHGPYVSEKQATKELLRYCCYLESGPTLMQRFAWWIRSKFRVSH